MEYYRSYTRAPEGLGDWLDAAIADWEAGYWVGAGPETSSPFFGATGGTGGESMVFSNESPPWYVTINGVRHEIPVGFWGVWTIEAQDQWFRDHGASQWVIASYRNSYVPTASQPQQSSGVLETAANAFLWLSPGAAIVDQLVFNGQSGELAVSEAKRIASAGGDAARSALEFLADHGDFFAKIALALGVGYGASVAIFAAAAGIALIVLLKK